MSTKVCTSIVTPTGKELEPTTNGEVNFNLEGGTVEISVKNGMTTKDGKIIEQGTERGDE